MGMFGKLAKLGLAKKGYDTLRKPENQRRIKEGIAAARTKANSRRKPR
ncbi:MAG TPA: hypothetical protein VES21_03475 [Nocardioidaceae bacterium]|nr:hypothetical protein [Nocardioidaceae bacterium]